MPSLASPRHPPGKDGGTETNDTARKNDVRRSGSGSAPLPKRKCAILETISAGIAVLAAVAASIQVAVMRRIAYGERINEMFELMHNEHNRTVREVVWKLEGRPYGEWSAEEMRAVHRVAADYAQLGFILRHSYLRPAPFLDIWGRRAIQLYRIVGPFLEARRLEWDSPERWIYFEWLARFAWMDVNRRRPWWQRRSWLKLQQKTFQLASQADDSDEDDPAPSA